MRVYKRNRAVWKWFKYVFICLVLLSGVYLWQLYNAPRLKVLQAYPVEHYRVPIDLKAEAARVKTGVQPFWIMLRNLGRRTELIGSITLSAGGCVADVRREESKGWLLMDDGIYTFSPHQVGRPYLKLDPKTQYILNPIFFNCFVSISPATVSYSIGLHDHEPIRGLFYIEPIKEGD